MFTRDQRFGRSVIFRNGGFPTNLAGSVRIEFPGLQAPVPNHTRRPVLLGAMLVCALTVTWWWVSSNGVVGSAPILLVASVPDARLAAAPTAVVAPAPAAAATKSVDAALPAAAFKLVGTVMAANGAGSFAMVRRTADSQLVQLRAGDRVDGLTVSAIGADSVVLAGPAHSIVIEADKTAAFPASPVRSRVVSPPPVADVEPAWAGDPAPFGH